MTNLNVIRIEIFLNNKNIKVNELIALVFISFINIFLKSKLALGLDII